MRPETPKLLEDIRDACSFIVDVTADHTQEQFEQDRRSRQAVERNFEIIGEAIRRIAAADPDTAAKTGDTRKIIGFRNILIHGYDAIDYEIVWLIIRDDMPQLLARVEALLENV